MNIRLADPRVLTFLLFILSVAVYSTTVCPTVSFTDNGELATVAATLGIAHPTGYPLFSLLYRVAAIPHVFSSPIAQLNEAAALVTALAVCLLFQVLLASRNAARLFGAKPPVGQSYLWAALLGSSVVAFSETVWTQATALEVYGLHLVLMLAATLFFIRGLDEQLRVPETLSRSLFAFAFVLGLSFSNHMTTVLLAPAFLYLYFSAFGFSSGSFRRILKLAPVFLLGLSVYLYLPVRSSALPPVDWGHPVTWDRLLRHVSGSQYRVWMFSGAEVMKKQLSYFVSHFPSEFHFALLPLIVYGWWRIVRSGKRLAIFLHVLILTTLVYASNYDIFDIDSYFLTVYVAVGWFLMAGAESAVRFIRQEGRAGLAIAAAAVIAIGIQVSVHHRAVNESDNMLVADHVQNLLAGLPERSVFITGQWDYTVSPLLYYQTVENVRTDLTVVDKNLLMNRPWYFAQLARTDPGIFRGVEQERDAFLDQLVRFDEGRPFNRQLIQERWDALLAALLSKRLRERPVYADPRIVRELPPVASLVLDGLAVRITPDTAWRPERRQFRFRPWEGEGVLVRDLSQAYVGALLQQAVLDARAGEFSRARQGVEKALEIDPGNQTALNINRTLIR
jgi:hypothetical protein